MQQHEKRKLEIRSLYLVVLLAELAKQRSDGRNAREKRTRGGENAKGKRRKKKGYSNDDGRFECQDAWKMICKLSMVKIMNR